MWLGQRRRAIFQQKVDSLLHSRRLPSTRGATIKVPRPCFVPAVKKAIRTAVSQHPHWDPLLRQHVLQSTRIVLGKEITFADKQNCGARSQDFDWDLLRSVTTAPWLMLYVDRVAAEWNATGKCLCSRRRRQTLLP